MVQLKDSQWHVPTKSNLSTPMDKDASCLLLLCIFSNTHAHYAKVAEWNITWASGFYLWDTYTTFNIVLHSLDLWEILIAINISNMFWCFLCSCGEPDRDEMLLGKNSYEDEFGDIPMKRNSPPMVPRNNRVNRRPHRSSRPDQIYGKPTSRFSK